MLNYIKKIFNKKNNIDIDVNVQNGVSTDTFQKTELSEEDKKAQSAAEEEILRKKQKKQKLIKRIILLIFVIAAIVIIVILFIRNNQKQEENAKIMQQVSSVRKMNLSSELSGTGTLAAKDTYSITSFVEGTVTGVYFDQGDEVKEGDLLITIEASSALREISNASASYIKAVEDYEKAYYDYQKIEEEYKGNTYKAQISGYLKKLNVKAGDKLSNSTEVCEIYDDSKFSIKVPFLSNDAKNIQVGEIAWIVLQENGEILQGYVKSKAEVDEVINGGVLVRYVICEVNNPGGLTSDYSALISVRDMVSVEDANFIVNDEQTIKFSDGSDVEVERILVQEGAYVYKGQAILQLTKEGARAAISSKKNTYMNARDTMIRAENTYNDALDSYDNYNITAPIDGTVISKNVKVGDKIQKSTTTATTLATIYDLSELTFSMSVDELDISNVQLGQEVNVQADAFNSKVFKGTITNISLVAANSNGVTNYPVTITIPEVGDLLPGMNVDGYVILAQAKDAICIPTDALQRGNVVYVLDTSPTIKEANGSINQEGISDRVLNMVPDGFTAIRVETGISNTSFIQVLSGLQEGDEVYVTASSNNSDNFMFGGMGSGMGGPPDMGGGGPR
ncbi:MAG: efflux RND transporter periplasmic adaptor subunit [Eubacteriales bacterium]|nr:efflux RND transporter periplasmic adaptor subunit [Eubacteriales bacterium]